MRTLKTMEASLLAFRENRRFGGGIHPANTLNLKKGTRTSN